MMLIEEKTTHINEYFQVLRWYALASSEATAASGAELVFRLNEGRAEHESKWKIEHEIEDTGRERFLYQVKLQNI